MKKQAAKDKLVTEEVIDRKLEQFLQQIVQDLSVLQGSKWEDNDRRWDENDRKWEDNDRRWDENDRRWEDNDRKWDRMFRLQDKILGKLENWEIENVMGTEHTRELRENVDDHEKRIKKLETAKN